MFSIWLQQFQHTLTLKRFSSRPKRRATHKRSIYRNSEVCELRTLLSGTNDSEALSVDDTAVTEAELAALGQTTEEMYVSDTQSGVDAATLDFVQQTSSLTASPDYETALAESPVAELAAPFMSQFSTLEIAQATVEAAQENAENEANVAAENAEVALGEDSSANIVVSDSNSFFSDAGPLGFASLLEDEYSNSGSTNDYSVDSQAGSDDSSSSSGDSSSSSDDSSSSSGDSSSSSGDSSSSSGDSSDEEDPDPRLDWEPLDLPEQAVPDYESLPLFAKLGDLSQVSPEGTDSYSDTTVEESTPVVTQTDPALGIGSRTESVTTTKTTKQEYVSEDEWTITQTITTRYNSDEDSVDENDVDEDFDRDTETTLTVQIINGTDTVVSYSVSDTFSFGTSSEWDNSAADEDEDSDGENSADDAGGEDDESESENGDTALDTDKGNFESSFTSSSTMSVSFSSSLVTLDGTNFNRIIMGFSSGQEFSADVAGGYEVGDDEGELKEHDPQDKDGDPGNDDNGGGDDTSSGDEPTAYASRSDTVAPGDDDFDPNAEPEHGGNGSSFGANADFDISISGGQNGGLSLGVMIPLGGESPALTEDNVFGNVSFGLNSAASASLSDGFKLALQESSGSVDDDSDSYTYIDVGFDSLAGGDRDAGFSLNLPIGFDPMNLPSPGDEPSEVTFNFGMNNYGTGNGTLGLKDKQRFHRIGDYGKPDWGFTQTGFATLSSSGGGVGFSVGEDDEGELTFSFEVETNSNSGVAFKQAYFQEQPYDSEFSTLRDYENQLVQHVDNQQGKFSMSIGGDEEPVQEFSFDFKDIVMIETYSEVITDMPVEGQDNYFEFTTTGLREEWITVASSDADKEADGADDENGDADGAGGDSEGETSGESFYRLTYLGYTYTDGELPETEHNDAWQQHAEREDGYWAGVGSVFTGYYNAAAGTVTGVYVMASSPIQTVKGIAHAARHPIDTASAVWEDVKHKSGSLEGQGELVGDFLIGLATGGTAKALKETEKVASIGRFMNRIRERAITKLKIDPGKLHKCPDGSPTCFVAGTQVVVAKPESVPAVTIADHTPENNHQTNESDLNALYAVGAFALGAGLSFRRKRQSAVEQASC